MNWKNVQRDAPPEHDQLVLLSVDGIYYITRYDSGDRKFRLHGEIETHFVPVDGMSMYWIEIDEPPRVKNST
jgi:hypothetical protein